MYRKKIIQGLQEAKAQHLAWMKAIKFMVLGFDIKEEIVPLNPTQSGFGMWFYGEAQKLKELRNTTLECMSHVEASHLKTHDIYFEIYTLLFIKKNQIFKTSQEDLVQAKIHYEALESASEELLSNTLRFEKRILAIPNEELEEIFSSHQ